MQLSPIYILILYLATLGLFGFTIVKRWFTNYSPLLTITASVLMGVGLGVPLTYLSTLLYAHTSEPILWGTITVIAVILVISYSCLYRQELLVIGKNKEDARRVLFSFDPSSIILLIFSLVFSVWLMSKTFHGIGDGQLFVGSNNVFDFSHAISIIRSFSWGGNIPMGSPFQAGLPFFYHFFFLFWVSIWEYFGVPLPWALNIPSVISFVSLLVVIYFLPQVIVKSQKAVGWLAVVFTITHSTLTFWFVIIQKGMSLQSLKAIWHIPTYPFAGPFDGSDISLFMTLNNYTNQRHLAFALALGLLFIMRLVRIFEEKKLSTAQIAGIAALVGLLFYWNMAVCVATAIYIVLFLSLKKAWREVVIFTVVLSAAIALFIFPYLWMWKDVLTLIVGLTQGGTSSVASLSKAFGIGYFWKNLGLLPFVIILGYFVISKKQRSHILPFVILFILECLYAATHGFDQKFLSFIIIGVNAIAATGVYWLWQRRNWRFSVLAILVVFGMTISGLIDLLPIKNEFAFPIVDAQIVPLITWIRDHTKKDAVFLSYSDMLDPVTFAGRKNYYGFFGNVGKKDRSPEVSHIYGGDISLARRRGIDYIVVPKQTKSDFPYLIHLSELKKNMTVVYETEAIVVLWFGDGMLK